MNAVLQKSTSHLTFISALPGGDQLFVFIRVLIPAGHLP